MTGLETAPDLEPDARDQLGDPRSSRASQDLFVGGGEMGELIRAMDWSQTPIGPIESWPLSLRTMVSFMLANRFPLLLWWGPQYISIYNDPYRPVLGAKHPWALGKPVSECWSEIWDVLQPLIDAPFFGGPATWNDDLLLELNRYGFVEETHFTVAYSPVPDESAPNGIGGVLATVHEVTEKIIGERRITALRDLGAHGGEAKSVDDACTIAMKALKNHAKDVPFAAIYLLDETRKTARLVCATGLEPGEAIAPPVIDADACADAEPWPIAELLRSEKMVPVENLSQRFPLVPPGPWSDAPHTAMVVPIKSNSAHQLAGFMIAGVSARLRLDEQYRSFFDLVASQIAAAIATARAYEEERKRAEALAEIDRAKTLFFSNVSHEFRTPLTLMLGPLEDALSSAELPVSQRGRLDLAHRNSLRLLKLVNSLLDFSRIEAGRMQASYEPVDLAAFTAELASNFRSACERAGLELLVDCQAMPDAVYVDRDMWEKIVLNLLSNAFKFTFEGRITVGLQAVDGSAQLSVRDTGVGIPVDELPRVFERFHRIEGQQSRTYEGSGIGLALVQELVKLHHGSIRAESEARRGAAFIVTMPFGTAHLPADRVGAKRILASTSVRADAYVQEALRWLPDPAHHPESSPEVEPRDGAPPTLDGARVLLADDNADMRAYVRTLLGPNCDLQAVADGQAALEAARRRRPDVVITDVMMPGLDGFQLVHAIRADPALCDVPIIMLSARAGEESRVEGLDAGADDYLVKPFSAREFVARVSANLKLAQVRREGSQALRASERRHRELLDALPAAVYTTNAAGLVTYFNEAAADLAGRRPVLGKDHWCVTWKLYRPDGTPLPHDECPLAVALKENRAIRGEEAVAERPDGTRVPFIPYPTPIRDETGRLIGAVNVMVDITDRKRTEELLRKNEAWLIAQKEAFQAAMDGAPLATSLGILIRTAIEQAGDERQCAFYIEDGKGGLQHVVGMPEPYARGVAGFNFDPQSLARHYDDRGCWSFPVETATGQLVGSFAMYFKEPREVTPRDRELAAALTHAAAIIISRDREAEERARISKQFETLLNQAPLGVYLVDSEFRIRAVNPVARPVFGDIPDLIGRDFDEVIHILWPLTYADEIVQRFRHTLQTGESYQTPERVEQRLDRKVKEYYEWRIDRIPLGQGRFGVVCYFRDISVQVATRERLKLLIDELNHRVKNTLAAVQAIAAQTLRNAPSTAEGRDALEARLLALASAHDVLTRRHWEGADIYEVIDASLGAYRNNVQESRLEVAGPDIRLRPKAALALSMALHELATNAAKYGALSTDAGRVDVNWSIPDTRAPRFSFRWVESNGPPVTTPQRRGFGSRLIERGLAQDLDGNIRLEFPPSGVICIIDAPLQEIVRAEDGRAGESP